MYILFDIGGTKMRMARSRDLESFGEPEVVSTPKDFDEMVEIFFNTARTLADGEEIEAMAGGIAGPFMRDKVTLAKMPMIPQWGERLPVKEKFEHMMKVPVHITNDAAMVGLGEALYGSGRGGEIVVYMTISTGVGGARIVNGRIDANTYGFEPGWQIIDAGKALCPDCSMHGYLIDYVSGTSVEKREGKKPYEITDDTYWDKMAQWLAYGINNTIVHWSPDVVVLGGSMMKEIGIHVDHVDHHLRDLLRIYPELPEIRKAELDDFGGLFGAMGYLKSMKK